MRSAALLLALALTAPLLADVRQLVNEGIALYDARRYDEAIAKFNAALAEDPNSDLAAYELGLTYFAKNDTAQCIAVLEPRVKRKNPYQAPMHAILGNCYDVAGDPKRAIATYRKGLKLDPNETQLLYNLAVTLTTQKKYDEARKLLKQELALQPKHASGHYVLAKVFDVQGFRVPAIAAYLRFLSLSPTGERGRDAATRLLAILGAGIEQKGPGQINVTIDPKPRKEEGDWSGLEMILALVGAAKFLPDEEKTEQPAAPMTEFDKTRQQLLSVLALIADADARGGDYTTKYNVPFMKALSNEKLLDTFAGVALVSLDLPGTEEWMKQNDEAVQRYVAFVGK